MYKTGDVIVAEFCTRNPSTWAAVNADSTPAGTLVLNGSDNGASVSVANKETGVYTATVTLPTVADGDVLQVRAEYAISAVSIKQDVWTGAGVGSHAGDITGTLGTISSTLSTNDTSLDTQLASIASTMSTITSTLATVGKISVPKVAYQGNLNLYKDDSYGGSCNDAIQLTSTLTNDISSAAAHIEITSEADGAGTVYYSASDGTVSGSSGSWTISYDIPTTGTDDLVIGRETAHYHAWVVIGSDVATIGKGLVNVY